MVIKEQIMLTAFDLFSEHGIKNVSMDDIAHNASISKRTLYELFEDKETLLTECINLSYTKMRLSMKRLESEPITALEVALLFYEELMRRPRWFNRKFYDDLKRYPKALQKTEEEKSRFLKKCIKLLSRGAKEGVFQPNINFEIVALLAKEPHVVDVANFLNSMGANIRGAGTDVIRIVGVESLHKTDYSVIPDQIEAGTFMFAAAATHGDILVKNVIPKHLEATSAKLLEAGCRIEEFDDAVRVSAAGPLHNTQVTTLPYPGFPTDMQPQMAVVLGIAQGTSTVTESIFENRFKYVDELTRMGADIKVESNVAIINGVDHYMGARVSAPDLRAGAALVIAGLAAEGITVIDDIHFIERGYEEFPEKLSRVGAKIEKVSTEKEIQKFTLKVS